MLRKLLLVVLLALASVAQAAVYSLPWGPKPQFVDANGAPMSSGTLQTFLATSTTPQVTYTDSTGGVANPTTITLNVRGETPNEVWLTGGVSYKFVLKDSVGATVWTVDNIAGVNDVTSSLDEWKAGPTPTFVSATSFTLAGDQTQIFQIGRRVKTTNSGGTVYSTIANSVFGASTTVTVLNDSGILDSGLSAVSYGLLQKLNDSIPRYSVAYSNTAIASGRAIAARTNSVTPNTKLDITADELVLKDASNGSFLARQASITIDFGTTGANGLDTGTQQASTWYYGWLIAKPDGTIAGLGSTSATAPTLPTGYTFKALVTAARSSAATQFNKYRQAGNVVYYEGAQNIINASTLTSAETTLTLTSAIPPIAENVSLQVYGDAQANGGGAFAAFLRLRVLTGTNLVNGDVTCVTSGTTGYAFNATLPNVSQQAFLLFANTTNLSANAAYVDVTSFKLPMGGE